MSCACVKKMDMGNIKEGAWTSQEGNSKAKDIVGIATQLVELSFVCLFVLK